ncbi:MAG: PAS domain-containing protein, partial [Nitrospiria bacterium]
MDSDQSFNLLEQEKTQAQLVEELESLRKRIAELERGTERQRAEESLKSTLSLLTATLEATAEGILVVTNDWKIVTYNRKFIEMWRIPESMMTSRDDNQLLTFVLDQLK